MKLPRRKFLHLAAGAAALPAMSRAATAQAYPTRPVRLIVGFPAGGGSETTARLIGQWLSERLGQPFVIENRPGAGTNIATEAVVRAKPDGYTLLWVTPANAINATLSDKLNFNFIQDIAPVASILRQPNVMVAHPSFPAKTIPEFIALAKAHPAEINMASPGNGTSQHLTGYLPLWQTCHARAGNANHSGRGPAPYVRQPRARLIGSVLCIGVYRHASIHAVARLHFWASRRCRPWSRPFACERYRQIAQLEPQPD